MQLTYSPWVRRVETGLAVLLTMVAVWLHAVSAASAGPLWRDEAAGIEVAILPAMSEMWNNMHYDSFPALWLLLVRGIGEVAGPLNDTDFRVMGFTVGVSVIGALWIYARAIGHSLPLISLLLLSLSPSVIIWGDSARAYGLAMIFIVLLAASIWRLVESPGAFRFLLAVVTAAAAVHTIFFNSVIVLALCAGGAAVAVRKRSWRSASLVLLAGLLAALSLVTYRTMLRDAATWRVLAEVPEYGLALFLVKLDEVLRPAGAWTIGVWLSLLSVSLYGAWRFSKMKDADADRDGRQAIVIFSSVSLIVGVIAYLFFLEKLSYYPSPWYYLPLLTLVALCLDGLSGALVRTDPARTWRSIGLIILAAATIVPSLRAVQRPMTNAHTVAAQLQASVEPNDLVIVNPWFIGVSMYRYYRGTAPWMTLPPIGAHAFHRYDLIKERMAASDQAEPLRPLIDAAGRTLAGGGRVFVVGRLDPLPPESVTVLPPSPHPGPRWPEAAHRKQWSSMLRAFLQSHADSLKRVPLQNASAIRAYEDLHLFVAAGWRP